MLEERENESNDSSSTDSPNKGGCRPQADEQGTVSRAEDAGDSRAGRQPQPDEQGTIMESGDRGDTPAGREPQPDEQGTVEFGEDV